MYKHAKCKHGFRDTKYLILTDNKIQAKYKNKISYHLTICFLAKIQPLGLFHVNKTTNVILHDLSRSFIDKMS